ncbi:MAG TPA: STAS domain-containing protein [Polyangiaceae bacterium]|nr:STAS domain-containing protein [Polyangiaceae bacterium]
MSYLLTDNDKTKVLRIDGELDALSCPDLRPTLDVLAQGHNHKITVDLSGLRHLDSSGVGALVSLYKSARASGGSVRFVGVANQPLRIFKLLRLERIFSLAA